MKLTNYALTALTGALSMLSMDEAMAQTMIRDPETVRAARKEAMAKGLEGLDNTVQSSVRDTVDMHYRTRNGMDRDYHWTVGTDGKQFDTDVLVTPYNIRVRVRNENETLSHIALYSITDGTRDQIDGFTSNEIRDFPDKTRFEHFKRFRTDTEQPARFYLSEENISMRTVSGSIIEATAGPDVADNRDIIVKQNDKSIFGDEYTQRTEISKEGYGIADIIESKKLKAMAVVPCHTLACYDAFVEQARKKTSPYPSVFQRFNTLMAPLKHYFQP